MTTPPPPNTLAAQAAALYAANRFAEACPLLERLAAQVPESFEIHAYFGECLARVGDLRRAVEVSRAATRLAPDNPHAWHSHTMIAIGAADWSSAEHGARRFAQLTGDSLEALRTLAFVLHRRGSFVEAAEVANRGLRLAPADGDLHLKGAVAALALGRADEAATRAERGVQACGPRPDLLELSAVIANYEVGQSGSNILNRHRAACAAMAKELGTDFPAARPPTRALSERPRIGLLSSDLREHSVAYFARAILAGHDRAAFDLFVYSTPGTEDAVTASLKALLPADRWRTGSDADPRGVARQIERDGIDLLIELGGLTRNHNQRVMLLRPARRQATYLGHPSTTGNPAIDFRVVDAHTDPVGTEHANCEALVRIDPCFLCYTPPDPCPPPAPPRAHGPTRPFTFGSFNALLKLNDAVLALWGRILAGAPATTLLIKCRGLRDRGTRADLESRLGAAGIAPERVTLAGDTDTTTEHLLAYHGVDLALDTFPYCGTTTTCESLVMGVPVLTLAGSTHASRVGLSLLHAAGMGDFVTTDQANYVARAIELSKTGISEQNAGVALRERVLATPLCDSRRFTSAFTRAVAHMLAAPIG